MQISPILWLAAAVGFLALEASTFNMTSIWFAIGAAAALISCLFTDLFRVQALLFIVVSVLCLLAFRPLAAKLRKTPTATNGDRNLGREATVLTPVTAEEPGRVRLCDLQTHRLICQLFVIIFLTQMPQENMLQIVMQNGT